MPPRTRAATFGVWYDVDGEGYFEFQRWLLEDEAGEHLPLSDAAQIYLDSGGPRGAELRPGRYLIQRLNRGASGAAIQAMTFNAVVAAQPLLVQKDIA